MVSVAPVVTDVPMVKVSLLSHATLSSFSTCNGREREKGRERGREGEREGGREGGREGKRERGGGREGGGKREGGSGNECLLIAI